MESTLYACVHKHVLLLSHWVCEERGDEFDMIHEMFAVKESPLCHGRDGS